MYVTEKSVGSWILGGLLLVAPLITSAQDADPDAVRVIQELKLREANEPIRDDARWRKPEKVAVLIRANNKNQRDQLIERFGSVAGDAEIIPIENFSSGIDVLSDVDVYIGFCNKRILNAAKEVRWIHSYAVGIERCTRSTDTEDYDFVLTNNQRLSGPDIAEHAIALLMALTRNLDVYHRNQLKNEWIRGSGGPDRSLNLNGRTMLILGLGGIGTEIARRASALGVRVTATRNSSRSGPDFVDYVGLSDEMYQLAVDADFVMNALPLTGATHGIVDRKFFDALKPGAYYVTVGRGKTTVTDDLVAVLESGRLAGAGLDVTDPEPLPSDHKLWQMPGVIITPHVAGGTIDARQRSYLIAIENLRRYVRGEKLLNVVDIRRGY